MLIIFKKKFLVGRFITSLFPVYGFVLILTIFFFMFVMQFHEKVQSILSDNSRQAGCVWTGNVFSRDVLWRGGGRLQSTVYLVKREYVTTAVQNALQNSPWIDSISQNTDKPRGQRCVTWRCSCKSIKGLHGYIYISSKGKFRRNAFWAG